MNQWKDSKRIPTAGYHETQAEILSWGYLSVLLKGYVIYNLLHSDWRSAGGLVAQQRLTALTDVNAGGRSRV